MSHTPGPWTVNTDVKKYYSPQTGEPYEVESVWIMAGESPDQHIALLFAGLSKEETSKFAPLIAAAPEMLAALEAARDLLAQIDADYLPHTNPLEEADKVLGEAIRKARGEA